MDDISSEAGEMNRYLMCKLKNMVHDLIATREKDRERKAETSKRAGDEAASVRERERERKSKNEYENQKENTLKKSARNTQRICWQRDARNATDGWNRTSDSS